MDEAVALAIPDEAIGNAIQAVVTIVEGSSLDRAELKRHCSESCRLTWSPKKSIFAKHFPAPITEKSTGVVCRVSGRHGFSRRAVRMAGVVPPALVDRCSGDEQSLGARQVFGNPNVDEWPVTDNAIYAPMQQVRENVFL
ncbi:MAG: hypothetical protein H0W43_01110 [Chthoniobacterales bacterium]|nr:hypothetical protein [Chthoniobacterales bacterium]